MLSSFAQAVVTGLALGAIYALAASGLGIVFGLFRVINFAHTQYMMIGAVTAIAAAETGAPYSVALLAGVMLAALCGALTERFLVHPLIDRQSAQVNTLFVTLGLAVVLENAVLLLHGSQPQYFDPPVTGFLEIGGVVLGADRIMAMVVAFVVFAALHLAVTRTRIGKAVLATAQNPDAAQVIGIPVNKVRLLAFLVGCGLAGLGGVLWGTLYSVTHVTGAQFLIISFVLVVMSGPGNIIGILLCSVLLGVSESIAGFLFDPKWQRLVVMLLFILVVVRRPHGLFGPGRFARVST
ncbi:MAG: branched-chain amino acid ABC transporter permease [Hyphomicrobiaceae bacterium]